MKLMYMLRMCMLLVLQYVNGEEKPKFIIGVFRHGAREVVHKLNYHRETKKYGQLTGVGLR